MRKLLFLLCMLASAIANAQAWMQRFPMFYQRVNAIAQSGNTVYVGGSFDYLGPNEGSYTVLDSATGSVNTTYPRIFFYKAMIADGKGGWYVWGDATVQIGGQFRNRLAHVYANGVLSAWNPNPNGIVKDLKVYGDRVFIAGDFDTVGGQRRRYIAALDTISGAATTWNPAIDQRITTLAVTNNSVYVAGQFNFVAGQVRGVLAAFDATTGAITSWDPSGGTVFTAYNPDVTRLEANGNTVYASGNFTKIGGQSRNYIAAINATTGAVTPWNPNPNDGISDWVVSGTTVYLLGSFQTVGGQTRWGTAAIDSASGLANSWNPGFGANGGANKIIVNGNTVYISVNTGAAIFALDATTGVRTSWDPNFKTVTYPNWSSIDYIAAGGGKIFAGGRLFYSSHGQATKPLVALDAPSGNLLPWNPNVNGRVTKLVAAGNTLYVVGDFDSIGGAKRTRLAAVDMTTGLVKPWNPAPNSTIFDLVVGGGSVYLSGSFTSINGQIRNYLAAVDTTTGVVTSWAPVVNSTNCLLVANGNTLYVGGSFTTIGGQIRNNLASFNLSTGAVTSWNPNANSAVWAMGKNDSSLFISGSFSTIGTKSRNRLAAFDLLSDTLTNWTISTTSFSGASSVVANNNAVYLADGDRNTTATCGSMRSLYFGVFDARTGQAVPWKYPPGEGYLCSGLASVVPVAVYAIALNGSNVYLGGTFTKIGNYTSASFAVFGDTTNATPTLPPVRFTRFEGQRQTNGSVQLNWQTADENYVSGYEVQSSIDSINFTTRGTVMLNAAHNYQFTDPTTDTLNFYRIKAIPTSGYSRYSSTIKLGPLPPVRFVRFEGQRQASGSVKLNWEIANENYVSGYEVQRSTDSLNFIPRGAVALNSTLTYQFTDQTTDTLNFFRIRAIPISGTTHYSGIVKLSVQQPQQTVYGRVILYPNPSATNQMALHLDSLPPGTYQVSVYNFSGNRVLQQSITHPGGQANLSINVSLLTSGIYIVTLTDASGNVIIRERWMKL